MELHIETRNYSKYIWKVANSGHEDISNTCPNPLEEKLFHGSVFDVDTGILLPSPILKNKKIPGILILEGNKTYGRQIKGSSSSSGKGRLYYRCIPHNKHLPVFLIPYESAMDFSKHQVNLFVLFEYKEWTASHAPYGVLTETIGKVSDLSAYYEYLLHCRGMHFTQQTAMNQKIRRSFCPSNSQTNSQTNSQKTETKTETKTKTKMKNGFHFDPKQKSNTKPNPDIFIFSIDPLGSKDLDDAFSIHPTEHESHDYVYVIRIYISDMVYWATQFQLWEDLRLEKTGANTLYLPDRNRVMVPSILSDQKASLLADGELRPVMVYELEISLSSGKVIGYRFYRDQVFIHANYRYDTEELEKCEHYRSMFEVTRKWTCRGRHEDNIQDSHELVAYWMVEYNRAVGKELSEIGRGIYRVCLQKLPETIADSAEKVEPEWKRIMRYWKSDVKGQYAFYSSERETMVHYGMGEVYYYAHASSPIRRLVDIYNQSCLVNKMDSGVGVDGEGMRIFQTEMEKMETMIELNRQTSESKRVQMECEMLAAFFSCPDIELVEYEGTVMDVDVSRGAWVYLSFWKRVVFVGGGYEDISIGDRKKCQIFLFEEEEKANRKVAVRFVG
jgi:exoribonuclease R